MWGLLVFVGWFVCLFFPAPTTGETVHLPALGFFAFANLFNQHLALSTFLLRSGWLPEAPANGLKRSSRNLQFVSHPRSDCSLPAFWSTCHAVWAHEPAPSLLTAALLTPPALLRFVLLSPLLSTAPASASPWPSRYYNIDVAPLVLMVGWRTWEQGWCKGKSVTVVILKPSPWHSRTDSVILKFFILVNQGSLLK